jgi:hypothetical protein
MIIRSNLRSGLGPALDLPQYRQFPNLTGFLKNGFRSRDQGSVLGRPRLRWRRSALGGRPRQPRTGYQTEGHEQAGNK